VPRTSHRLSTGPDQKHDPTRTGRGLLRRKGFGQTWFRLRRAGTRRRLARGLVAPAISAHASRRSASSSACRRYAAAAAIHASKLNASSSENDTPRASRTIIYTGNSRQGRRFLNHEGQDSGCAMRRYPVSQPSFPAHPQQPLQTQGGTAAGCRMAWNLNKGRFVVSLGDVFSVSG